MKEYLASELVVEIRKLGKVKLVVSKKEKKNENEKPNFFFFFYMSTDLCLTLEEVLEIENRWSIELAHARQIKSSASGIIRCATASHNRCLAPSQVVSFSPALLFGILPLLIFLPRQVRA